MPPIGSVFFTQATALKPLKKSSRSEASSAPQPGSSQVPPPAPPSQYPAFAPFANMPVYPHPTPPYPAVPYPSGPPYYAAPSYMNPFFMPQPPPMHSWLARHAESPVIAQHPVSPPLQLQLRGTAAPSIHDWCTLMKLDKQVEDALISLQIHLGFTDLREIGQSEYTDAGLTRHSWNMVLTVWKEWQCQLATM